MSIDEAEHRPTVQHPYQEHVYDFVNALSVEQLREIARCAIDLAWPPLFRVDDGPVRMVDAGARATLQTAIIASHPPILLSVLPDDG